jgi:hypothetical protein
MKPMLAIILLLSCVLAGWGQRPAEPGASEPSDSELAPPPTVNTFQGDFIYRVNPDIRAPEVITAPDPPPLKDFSAGKVVLWCVVGTDGKAHLIKIAKHYTMEADVKAVENLKQWKFSPGMIKKDKKDVVVLTKVEVVWR